MATKTALPALGEQRAVIARINRAHGQLGAISRMINEGRDCEEIVTQLAAVNKAISAAAYDLIASSLRSCLTDGGGNQEEVAGRLKKVFLALA